MEITSAIETLAKLPLLHQLMRLCPLPDPQLEEFFVDIRRAILKNRGKLEELPADSILRLCRSIVSLTNIFIEDDDENLLVCDLELEIASAIANSQQPRLTISLFGFLPPSAHLRLVQ